MRLEKTELGRRLARIDRHLMACLGLRVGDNGVSAAVAENKRHAEGVIYPVKRAKIEEERLAMAATWALGQGVDPNFASSFLYSAITESCRIQMEFMYKNREKKHLDESNPDAVIKYYRGELLRLTKAVASTYDAAYAEACFATDIHRRFEQDKIDALIGDRIKSGTLLDLGCATGITSRSMSKSFAKIVGYDVSSAMIKKATEKSSNDGHSSFVIHDLENGIPQADNSASLVMMNFGTASDIININGLMAEINRVLTDEGKFFLSFYNSQSLLAHIDFLPWAPSLAAYLDQERNCLEVRVGGDHFFIHAKAYRPDEIKGIISSHGLVIESLETHPTISPVLPDDILSTCKFDGFVKRRSADKRWHQAKMTPTPSSARPLLIALDRELATSPLQAGAYIIVTGTK